MFDPASPQNWIDAPAANTPFPFPFAPPEDPPDEIDHALDTLAEAIKRAGGDRGKNIAHPIAQMPERTRLGKALAQIPSSKLIAFLERHNERDQAVTGALLPAITAADSDRMARVNVFRRVTMTARMYALHRACQSAASQGAQP